MKSDRTRLPTALEKLTFSFFGFKDLGKTAPVSTEFKMLSDTSFTWNSGLKDEFKQPFTSIQEAKTIFLNNPAARLSEYLLIDNAGKRFFEEKVRLSAHGSNAKDEIEILIQLQRKGVFSAGIVRFEECLGISSLGLYILNKYVFNEHGIEAFKKGFIKASDFMTMEWRIIPGFLGHLFTKEGLSVLEAGRLTAQQVLACGSNQDCEKLILTAYNEMLHSKKP